MEELDVLSARVRDLIITIQSLRSDNQQLREKLASAASQLDSMRGRVDEAARRLDVLVERLPSSSPSNVPWSS
jgi:outer membrane murein-binding lipoprotein Lpp